ncbi:hypothetical protein MTR67_026791 [Solanum verrucosum]|uniref:Uncharacterized protein n=1 Tax=Solanum verrucosum TaxID=315347 RepID=A0AAF0R171_SOLVR|nr:hypothetical protein MTR67_026791 [Solanum verrucosum]
MRRLQLLRSL